MSILFRCSIKLKYVTATHAGSFFESVQDVTTSPGASMASPGPLQQSPSRPRSQPCPWQSIFHTVARESLLNRRQIMCLPLSEPPGVPSTLREQAKDPTMACMTCHLPSTPSISLLSSLLWWSWNMAGCHHLRTLVLAVLCARSILPPDSVILVSPTPLRLYSKVREAFSTTFSELHLSSPVIPHSSLLYFWPW